MDQKKTAYLGLFAAIAIIFGYVESLIPFFAGIPGMKLGLANLITLLAMVWYGPREAGLCLLCRILLCSFFAGQAVYFLYSLAGGTACYLMLLLFRRAPLWAASAFAAIGHNVGQLCVAGVLGGTFSVFWLLLYLAIGAIISGSIIGVAASILVRRLERFIRGGPSCRS